MYIEIREGIGKRGQQILTVTEHVCVWKFG
jgi:hypothetical protein